MADCTYRVPDLEASGDALYGPRTCYQPFLNWAWPVHGFNYDWYPVCFSGFARMKWTPDLSHT